MSNTPDKRTRDILKEYFETGDRPKEIEFSRLIDSGINQKDDELYAENGNIGIGTNNPQSKLHVAGDIAVTSHIHGDKTNKANDSDVLIVENGSQVQLHGPRHTGKSGGIVIGAKKDNSNPTSGKILFSQVSQTGWQDNVVIDHQGNMGIGTIDPKSKLHVHQNGGNTTGLRLSGQDNVNPGDILALDQGGNAKWVAPTSVTSGLWQAMGTTGHIRNGNTGNVGVGTSNPQATLDISGTSENENNHGILKISAGTVGKDLRFGVVDGTGGYTWIQSHGAIPLKINPHPAGNTTTINEGGGKVGIGISSPQAQLHLKGMFKIDTSSNDVVVFNDTNYPNGTGKNTNPFTILDQTGSRGFRFWLNANAEHNNFEAIRIEPAGNLRMNNHSIFLRAGSDQNHGIKFVYDNEFDNQPNRINGVVPKTLVDGLFAFGYQGGALGTAQTGSENVALQWFRDKSVDFKGNLTVKKTPLFVKKFYSFKTGDTIRKQNNGSYTSGDANDLFIIGEYPPSHYEAIIGNFSFNHFNPSSAGSGQVSVWIEKHDDNNAWALSVRFPNSHNSEKMVTVFFIRKELF